MNSIALNPDLFRKLSLPVILIAIQALVATASLHSLSILGVYIEAGSHWSRTQQTATNFLIQYLDQGDEHDYEKFLVAVAKDFDSNAARRALETPEPDIPAATASFLRFGIYPDDIPGAIFMYVHLRQYSYFRQAIAIWQDSDAALAELEALGETIHAQVQRGGPPKGDAALKTRLRELDERLSTICVAFSKALGADVRALTTLVTFANLALAIVLMVLVVWRMGALFRRSQRFESALSSEKRQAETAHRHLDIALDNIAQGVCFFDGDRRLIVANRRYQEIYRLPPDAIRPGVKLEECIGYRYAAIGISNSTSADYLRSLQASARAGQPNQAVIELNDGRAISIQTQPMPDGGWVATHEDITERRRAEEKIEFLAKHDALTGLANRPLLLERIGQALVDSAPGRQFAILYLDLDRFKAVNDMLGHDAGDELLRNVAKRLAETVGKGGTVARIGGDEFVVLQTGISGLEDAAQLARRITNSVGEPYLIDDKEVVVSVSVGMELSSHQSRSVEVLLKNADIALYMAKRKVRAPACA